MNTTFLKQTKLLLLITVSTASLLFSCNGNSNPATIKSSSSSSTVQSTGSATANSTGDASYSYTIDGKSYSGSGTNEFVNAARTDKPGVISINLAPVTPGSLLPGYGFYLEIENKGTLVVRADEEGPNSIYYNPPNSGVKIYKCKEITVTITTSGGSRFAGTFSGTMIEPNTDREVAVTDGKFDLPIVSPDKQ